MKNNFKTNMFRDRGSKHFWGALILTAVILSFIAVAPLAQAEEASTGEIAGAAFKGSLTGSAKALNFVTGNVVADLISGAMTGILNIILYEIALVISILLAGSGWLADQFIQPFPLTSSPLVQTGWGITRDFANMFFILILLGIALDYILFQSIGVKRALPMLILVALLINFSLPIAGVFIDFANVFTSFFLEKITTTTAGPVDFSVMVASSLNLPELYDLDLSKKTAAFEDLMQNTFVSLIFAIIFMSGMTFIFLALALMFLIRTGWLFGLLIVLPLVLALKPLPATSRYFGQWSNKFIQWTMFAPVSMFFLYLSMLLWQGTMNAANLTDIKEEGFAFSSLIYNYVVVWFFMIGSLIAGQAMGVKTAGAALGTINSAQGWASGKIKGGLKGMGKTAGRKVLEKTEADKWVDRAAKATEQHWYMGGKLTGRALRGVSGRAAEQIKKMGEPTSQELVEFDRLNPIQQIEQIENLKNSLSPRSKALAFKLAVKVKKRNLMKLDPETGEPMIDENEKLVKDLMELGDQYGSKAEKDQFQRSNPVVAADYIRSQYQKKLPAGQDINIWKDPATGKRLEDALKDAFSFGIQEVRDQKGMWNDNAAREWVQYSGNTTIFREAYRIGDNSFIESMENTLREATKEIEAAKGDMEKTPKWVQDFLKTPLYRSLETGAVDDIIPADIDASFYKTERERRGERKRKKKQREERGRAGSEEGGTTK